MRNSPTYLNLGRTKKTKPGTIRERLAAKRIADRSPESAIVIRLTPESYMLADDARGNPVETSDRWKAARFSTVFSAQETLRTVGGVARWQDATLEAVMV